MLAASSLPVTRARQGRNASCQPTSALRHKPGLAGLTLWVEEGPVLSRADGVDDVGLQAGGQSISNGAMVAVRESAAHST